MSTENEDDNLEAEDVEVDAEDSESPAVRDEPIEFHSSETHRKLRDKLEAEIQAFLAAGGSIEKVEANIGARSPIITASAGDDAS